MTEAERAVLEAAIGHHFREPARLARALTHSSRRYELAAEAAAADNEQLEFLGDAVLGLVVSEYLVASFPDWSVGELNRAKERMVSERSLHAAAVRLSLGEYLDLGRGEEKTGGREKRGLLADAYEAIIAAIYLDAGLNAAAQFVYRTLVQEVLRDQGPVLREPDAKAALRDRLFELGRGPAEYRVVEESGPDHRKTFVIEVRVEGHSLASARGDTKKEAELAAASLALEQLRPATPES
jgi:ribonuclease-3